jgi:hypothetical protein
MNITKAINTKTLLIPSLFLNVVLLLAVAHFGRELGNLITEMSSSPTAAWSAHAAAAQRDAGAPAAAVDASSVPTSGTQPSSH